MNKEQELQQSVGKAQHRLLKDILFSLVIKLGHKCFRCDGDLTRDTFSIEHKVPWRFSENPLGLFFDLDNIAFSHKKCNYSAARKVKSLCGTRTRYRNGCRCSLCYAAAVKARAKYYTTAKRQKYYKQELLHRPLAEID